MAQSDLTFNLNDSSNDIQLRVTNGAGQSGPIVQVFMLTQSHGGFSFS